MQRSKQFDALGGTVNTTAVTEGPTMSQRDPSQPHNQLRPRSLRSSGMELDECCEGGMDKSAGQDNPGINLGGK